MRLRLLLLGLGRGLTKYFIELKDTDDSLLDLLEVFLKSLLGLIGLGYLLLESFEGFLGLLLEFALCSFLLSFFHSFLKSFFSEKTGNFIIRGSRRGSWGGFNFLLLLDLFLHQLWINGELRG